MIIRTMNEADYTLKISSVPSSTFQLTSFSCREGISQLFSLSVDLASQNGQIDFDTVIGKSALLTIHGPSGKRYIHGMVCLLERNDKNGPWTPYRAEIVPSIWFLSKRQNCRIFQNKSVPDIIKQVLTDAGIASDQFKFSLKKDYQPRDYCVQYRESDLAFVTRLMEQYGIFYFFEHSEKGHLLVMGDDASVHLPIANPPKVIYQAPGTTGVSAEEHIYDYQYQQEVRSDGVRLRDFDFKKPTLNLEQEAKAEGKLEVYDYPGEYTVPDEGKGLAKVRLEDLLATKKLGVGQSDCRRLIPGFRFTLSDHDRSDFNREYLLLRVMQSGSQPQVLGAEAGQEGGSYQNSFECIPSDVPFRPARMTSRPLVQGPQTAIVVGPAGDEIYTDEYGRIKVQFHWDREGKNDEKSSCWIRVAQVWAGANWGAIYIPRIGQEVIVEFLEGDPDQPIITGRFYNGANMPPYGLPDKKTQSTIKSNSSKGGDGSNELRFEDAKGSEEVYLHGEKDWTILIENDKNQAVGHDETLKVGNDRSKQVVKNQTEDIGENKTITVGKNHTESIGDNARISVGKDESIDIGDNQTLSVGKNQTITVGKDLSESVTDNADVSIGKNLSVSVSKNSDSDIGENFTGNVGKKATVQVGDNTALTVNKKLSVQATDAISIVSDKEIVLKTGDASITMKKNGDIVIKGKKISVTGSGDIVMKGSKITQN